MTLQERNAPALAVDRDSSGASSAPASGANPATAPDGDVPRLSVVGISRSFEGIHALNDVSFDIAPGTIHALVGENGAGKSTLVKIITGVDRPDAGVIHLDGSPVVFRNPMEARAAGVTAVYQEPQLFPHLDVAENIFMGIHPTGRLGFVNRRRMYGEAGRLLRTLGVSLEPTTLVAGLSVADLQAVEIARATSGSVRLLILDEPTAALTPAEADRLFAIARGLRSRGTSVLFISHRLEELTGFVDTVTVLRDGQHVTTMPAAAADRSKLVRLMVGRSIGQVQITTTGTTVGKEVLRVENLCQRGVFDDVTFGVRTGEIVGMAGLVGSGRSEIAQTIFGIAPPTAGRVLVDGQEIQVRSPWQMLSLGVAYLPEDRDGQGLVTQFSITSNIVLPVIRRVSRRGFLQPRRERRLAGELAETLEIEAGALSRPVSALSGGNRQKVVFAKWLTTQPRVLILDEPTHGIDVGTKAQVHQVIADMARNGRAVLVISSDLPEVLAMSHRILVIAEGRLVAE
ncbi:MAG TPA: sugar ABC transporter ATP-binding protein, partial [Candidatus Saccharimonadales bacterium]|nr:sugar ABC transporter ATP-binding protein [Candidatus Saccharimonadales bacterium]